MSNSNQIFNEDCLEALKSLPDNSVDTMVTDPPYGYSFMCKDWDKSVPSVEIWKECIRVLKAGSFAFVMCAPRQDVLSQMIVRLGEAGFDTGFTSIYWTYSAGFPKSLNIYKKLEKDILCHLSSSVEIVKKKLENHHPTSKEMSIVVKNADISSTHMSLTVNVVKNMLEDLNASKTHGDNQSYIITVPISALHLECVKTDHKIKEEEVQKTEHGSVQLLNVMDISANYVEVIENLKHIILKQLKIILQDDTTL